MRTTVNIDDRLLQRARDAARREQLSMGEIITASLQHYLSSPLEASAPTLPTASLGEFHPGIDPTSNASLFAALDAAEADEALDR